MKHSGGEWLEASHVPPLGSLPSHPTTNNSNMEQKKSKQYRLEYHTSKADGWLYALTKLTQNEARIVLRRLAEKGKDTSRCWVIATRNSSRGWSIIANGGDIDRAVIMPSEYADALSECQRASLKLYTRQLPRTGCNRTATLEEAGNTLRCIIEEAKANITRCKHKKD